MIGAVDSSLFSGVIDSGPGRAALEAQLARYQKELSGSVNCDSAKTIKGKAEIQELSGQINETKARIEEAENAKSSKDRPEKASWEAGAFIDVCA